MALVVNAYLSKAQKFFYVEEGSIGESPIKQGLLKASQFVAKSAIGSEYIIKTELGAQTKYNMPIVKITLVDSMTFKTIFQTEEAYSTKVANIHKQAAFKMAMNTLIEKNIKEIILWARNDNFYKFIKLTGLKKDKT